MKLLFVCFGLLAPLLPWVHCDLPPSEFSMKYIQYILNATSEKMNMAVAPREAYEIYQELLKPPKPAEPHYYWHDLTTTPPNTGEFECLVSRNISTSADDILYSTTMRARWSFNFQSRDTHKQQFYQYGSGDHRVWADFLRKDDIFHVWEMDTFNATVLQLPLHLNELKCLIILPNEYVSLDELKEFLAENPQVIAELLKKSLPMTLVRVLLPKFRVNYKQDLKEFYEELALDEFEKYKTIQHLTNLEANERGIGEFDRTTVLFWNAYSYVRISPKIFEINRPFLFLISSKEDIQFVGQVVKL